MELLWKLRKYVLEITQPVTCKYLVLPFGYSPQEKPMGHLSGWLPNLLFFFPKPKIHYSHRNLKCTSSKGASLNEEGTIVKFNQNLIPSDL